MSTEADSIDWIVSQGVLRYFASLYVKALTTTRFVPTGDAIEIRIDRLVERFSAEVVF